MSCNTGAKAGRQWFRVVSCMYYIIHPVFSETLIRSGDINCSWLFTLGNTRENSTEEMRIHNEHHMNSQNIEKATTQKYFSLLLQRSTSQVVNNIKSCQEMRMGTYVTF